MVPIDMAAQSKLIVTQAKNMIAKAAHSKITAIKANTNPR
jgi:hypothetical protein